MKMLLSCPQPPPREDRCSLGLVFPWTANSDLKLFTLPFSSTWDARAATIAFLFFVRCYFCTFFHLTCCVKQIQHNWLYCDIDTQYKGFTPSGPHIMYYSCFLHIFFCKFKNAVLLLLCLIFKQIFPEKKSPFIFVVVSKHMANFTGWSFFWSSCI